MLSRCTYGPKVKRRTEKLYDLSLLGIYEMMKKIYFFDPFMTANKRTIKRMFIWITFLS